MGITLILAAVVGALAVGVGLAVGRRRGPTTGVAAGVAVIAVGVVGYVGLVASTASM